jgi:microcin C transport system substrate-binding protein
VVYERVEDYWGRDLPVNRGRYNFDELKWDYFRDDQVLFEAVKGHLIDIRDETVPSRWFRSYDFPAVEAGVFKKDLVRTSSPSGLWWPIFWNLRQPRLQDIRVREALWLVRDPEWAAEAEQKGFWDLGNSFFYNSRMAHRGLPSEDELELLEPLRDQIPPRVFTQEFQRPPGGGKGYDRRNLKRAVALFEEAGWVIRDNKMVNAKTGEPFELRLVGVSPALAGSWIPYKRVLERLGIRVKLSAPEISNWLYRMRSGDFDGGAVWFIPDNTPTLLIFNSFSSFSAEQPYSNNWAHVKNPAVDALIEAVFTAKNEDEFLAGIRALDRVLLWNFYFIPSTSKTNTGLVYWDKYSHVETEPLLRIGYFDHWWWDEEKAARVAQFLGRQEE